MNKGLVSIAALLVAVVLFFAVNIAGSSVLRGARADLTEGKLYTLSEGSRSIARKLQEPVRLTLYYSEQAGNDVPMFKTYANRVKELLREYEQSSAGNIKLDIINPEPFSEDQDKADQAGLVGVPTGRGGDRFYFGLVGVNSTDKRETIPFFDPQKEGFLEYDITRLIYLLSDAPKKTVGVMSWLPIDGMPFNPMTGQRGGSPPWQILTQMREVFEVKTVETTVREIPSDINVLMVVHPKSASPDVQYAIDQFVLRGGRLLLFVDPLCDADMPPGMNPMQAMGMPRNSELATLMGAWGVEMTDGKVAGDRKLAMLVGVGSQARQEAVNFLPYLQLDKDDVNTDDPVTGGLNTLRLITPGILAEKQGSTTTIEVLAHTTTDSTEIPTTELSMVPDPKALMAKFVAHGKELTLAARITGNVKSAFPDGPPPAAPPAEGQPPEEAPKVPHIAECAEPIGVIVIADCDMLQDRIWLQPQRLFGQIDLGFTKTADNGDLVIAALDNLGGSSDLMSLRARSKFARPFDKVEEIQRDARQRYLKTETELQEKLRTLEQEINQIQQTRPDGQASMLLTPEQQQKLDEAMKQRVATRKELRDVQHQLRKDIESLGTKLKAINMALIPGLVGLGAIALTAYRASRRRSDRLKPTTHA